MYCRQDGLEIRLASDDPDHQVGVQIEWKHLRRVRTRVVVVFL